MKVTPLNNVNNELDRNKKYKVIKKTSKGFFIKNDALIIKEYPLDIFIEENNLIKKTLSFLNNMPGILLIKKIIK
ncbi:hypothetical protein [Clostridium perfringens]|uniref:hypothetical protein n=1 Tax=Clostridium perfringens TaxID=1502 RepID=UPI0024BC632C|nr:hypothetical protein [Clostridium perfringens]